MSLEDVHQSRFDSLRYSILTIRCQASVAINPMEHLFSDDPQARSIAKYLVKHPDRTPTSEDLWNEVSILREIIRITVNVVSIDKTTLFGLLDAVLLDIKKLEAHEARKP